MKWGQTRAGMTLLVQGTGDPDGLLIGQVPGHVENHSPVRVRPD